MKAVRLSANRLFSEAAFSKQIEEFAAAQLQSLPQRPARPKPEAKLEPKREPEVEAEDEAARRPAPLGNVNNGTNTQKKGAVILLRHLGKAYYQSVETDHATAFADGMDAPKLEVKTEPTGAHSLGPEGAASEARSPESKAKAAERLDSEAGALLRHCELYCVLCTKKHPLLRGLLSTFGRVRENLFSSCLQVHISVVVLLHPTVGM